jgi:hypothetical protein
MSERFEQVTQVLGDVVDRAETSLRGLCHLAGHEKVDFASVIFIIGETLVNLRPSELREAVRYQRINRLAVLEQADDVVDANSSAFDYCVAAADSTVRFPEVSNILIRLLTRAVPCCQPLARNRDREGADFGLLPQTDSGATAPAAGPPGYPPPRRAARARPALP